jgi:hypothetical protein
MKDGRTHLAHKAEYAIDLATGVIVGVTVQDADEGDTSTAGARHAAGICFRPVRLITDNPCVACLAATATS